MSTPGLRALTQCAGKSSFVSWDEAETAAKRSRRRHANGAHPYRCQVCHQIHLGTGEGKTDFRKWERRLAAMKANKRRRGNGAIRDE